MIQLDFFYELNRRNVWVQLDCLSLLFGSNLGLYLCAIAILLFDLYPLIYKGYCSIYW